MNELSDPIYFVNVVLQAVNVYLIRLPLSVLVAS